MWNYDWLFPRDQLSIFKCGTEGHDLGMGHRCGDTEGHGLVMRLSSSG